MTSSTTNVITFLGNSGDYGFRDYAHATFMGISFDHNTFCVPNVSYSYWSWGDAANGWSATPVDRSTYLTESGMDGSSTLQTGDCSAPGRTDGCSAL